MMKKLLPLSAIAIGVMLGAPAAHAADQETFSGTGTITPALGDMNCNALDNNVTVQLSKNVIAGYSCNTSSFYAATCHTSGVNKEQTVLCEWKLDLTTADVLDDYTVNAEGCAAAPVVPAPTPAPTGTITGRVGFQGTSGGGTVGATQLKATDCTATTILNLAPALADPT